MHSVSSNPASNARSKNALRVWLQLLKSTKRIEGHLRGHFERDHNCSLSRFDVLANLQRIPGNTASTSQLAKMLLASKGNITRLLDRMEGDRLIERRPNKEDRRVSDIHLTDSGAELFVSMAISHEQYSDEIFSVLTDVETKTLIELLGKLQDRLSDIDQ